VTLNLEERLRKFPPDFKFNLDYAYWIVNLVLEKTAYRMEQKEEDIWVSLCSQVLKNHPYNYRNHIRYLCENFSGSGGVLYRNDYQKGRCYSYRISPYYFGDAVDAYELKDKKLLKFVKSSIGVQSNNAFKKKYNFLAKYFCSGDLSIDLKDALWENRLDYKTNYQKHLLRAIQATKIANGDYHLKHTPLSDGRIHSEITRLPKKFRKHLKFDGKRLGEVDISASVPTMLYLVLLNWGQEHPHLRAVIHPEREYHCHYMFLKSSLDLDMTEVEVFGQRLSEADFYDSFIEQMHQIHLYDNSLEKDEYFLKNVREMFDREFDGDLADLRAVMKKKILSMFNARPGYYKNEEYVFGKEYPSILNWIREFKKIDHRHFSHLTLQTESYFMLNIIARQLNKKYRGKIPILTLHDCIITTEDHLELLENFMNEILSDALGFTPKMKKRIYE
jgi:hypothetical protein